MMANIEASRTLESPTEFLKSAVIGISTAVGAVVGFGLGESVVANVAGAVFGGVIGNAGAKVATGR